MSPRAPVPPASARDEPALGYLKAGLVDEFRSVLATAGYTSSSVKAAVRLDDDIPLVAASVPLALWRLRDSFPLGPLVKLFYLCLPVGVEEAEAALAPLPLQATVDLGLVAIRAGAVQALVRLVPSGGLILACDAPADGPPRRDHVMGVSPSSVLLANLTVRKKVDTALDLGSGTGVHALLAARHARHVTATDISQRAVDFTNFNACLNGVANVEARAGSFFEPVQGQTFDLIVSNPPFVISPDFALLFRDGGLAGDELSRRLVTEVPGYLTDGGMAHLLVSWACRADDDRCGAPLRWLKETGCDARIVCVEFQDAASHAAGWNRTSSSYDERYLEDFNRWVRYLEGAGIEAIGTAGVILRRRHGRNWVRVDEVRRFTGPRAGDQLERLFDGEDRSARWSDEELLGQRLQPGRYHHVEQTLTPTQAGHELSGVAAVLDGGLPLRFALDPIPAAVVMNLDGSRTVMDAIVASARARAEEPDDLVAPVVDAVRAMVCAGVLVPAAAPSVAP